MVTRKPGATKCALPDKSSQQTSASSHNRRPTSPMSGVVQHFNFVIQVIEGLLFIAFQVNYSHASAAARHPRHFLHGFGDV
jgi:hypothetical protein